jgi:FHA domain-containing protein
VSRRLFIDDGRIQRELVVAGRTLVGRDPQCEVSHADPRLSRRHAEFRVTPDGVVVRDLGSRNGTHVNGVLVDEVVLAPGDVVQIADLTIRFDDDAAAPTVQLARAVRETATVADAPPAIEDDRTRRLSPAAAAAAHAPTAAGITLSLLDDHTRVPPASALPGAHGEPAPLSRGPAPYGSPVQPARLPQSASVPMDDVGQLSIRDEPAAARNEPPPNLSVFGLAASPWGRHVLVQGLALAFLVLVLTAAPLITWEVRFYGSTVLSSWPVLLPIVLAAMAAGLAVASLIARTTARGLSRDR